MGELVHDRYEILDDAGRGGEGRVVRALDHRHDRFVALKIRPVRDPIVRERALAETRMLLDLRPHPAVAVVRDDFVESGRHHLVMDWVEGRTLQELLDDEGDPGLPFTDVVRYLRQVAAALDHLHAHDPAVVHGDIKPANLVLTPDERLVVVDFGSAVRGSHPGSATPGFAAPEWRSGEVVGPAADVYGLAATAWALLTGHPPAPEAPELVEALRPGLAFDPALRPATATELLDRLAETTPEPRHLPRIVGRADDLSTLNRLLDAGHCVTIAGPGGVGKTRLALEVGAAASLPPVVRALAHLDLERGRAEAAVRLFAGAEAARERVGLALAPQARDRLEAALARARSELGEEFDPAWADGFEAELDADLFDRR